MKRTAETLPYPELSALIIRVMRRLDAEALAKPEQTEEGTNEK